MGESNLPHNLSVGIMFKAIAKQILCENDKYQTEQTILEKEDAVLILQALQLRFIAGQRIEKSLGKNQTVEDEFFEKALSDLLGEVV